MAVIEIMLFLYGTACALGYLTVSVVLTLVSMMLFVSLVGVASQVLDRGSATTRGLFAATASRHSFGH